MGTLSLLAITASRIIISILEGGAIIYHLSGKIGMEKIMVARLRNILMALPLTGLIISVWRPVIIFGNVSLDPGIG